VAFGATIAPERKNAGLRSALYSLDWASFVSWRAAEVRVQSQAVEVTGHVDLPSGAMHMNTTKIRASAIFALRISLRVLVSALLMLPLIAVVNRIFDGTWSVPLRMTLILSSILTGLVFAFLFLAQVLESFAKEHRRLAQRMVFPAAMWLRGLYLTCIVMGFGLMVGTYSEGDPLWVVVTPVCFVFLGFFAWPRTIEITEGAIRQRRVLFGFKEIRLDEIESVAYDAASGETIVFGKNGTRIVHTAMHVDGERFAEKLQSASGKDEYLVGDLG
jgi:hypothetical protein